jgi:hypothetical protein
VQPDEDRVIAVLLDALTGAERQDGVAYLRVEPLGAGEALMTSPGPTVTASVCRLAFVDPSPSANWGHDCRYLTIDAARRALASHPARFPPFRPGEEHAWRLVYRAAGVPDPLIFGPDNKGGQP